MSAQLNAVLVVEDSPQDYEATERALRDVGVKNEIIHFEDGDDVIDYLECLASNDPKRLPYLILLDLNLPGSSGHEVLETLRGNAQLRHLPVVVLTTSSAAKDIRKSYLLGANSYLQKPVNLNAFRATIDTFAQYWFHTALLPNSGEGRP